MRKATVTVVRSDISQSVLNAFVVFQMKHQRQQERGDLTDHCCQSGSCYSHFRASEQAVNHDRIEDNIDDRARDLGDCRLH